MTSTRPNDTIVDLSGLASGADDNPFPGFIAACDGDATKIQEAYDSHRTRRNAAQKDKFLADGTTLAPDLILRGLLKHKEQDSRNCLVIWTRPPGHIIALAHRVQEMITGGLPASWEHWLMPTHNMHMTVAEVAFSQPPAQIAALVQHLRPHAAALAHTSYTHRARLVRPLLSFDTSAFALSFVPASGEPLLAPRMAAMTAASLPAPAPEAQPAAHDDAYTYHHLRRDVFARLLDTGVRPAPRYQVPSAHITLGRFISGGAGGDGDPGTPVAAEDAQRWVRCVEEINEWLRATYWANDDVDSSGEWIVGQERGLDVRYGPVWYGGGKTVVMGEGF
ncbi:hypothetical protein BROUX41_000257 [Berkeleyomyces rouxiae]|uniref:uncharacterized protein n=1 Tax=Berkeleyomyces rouxiae TaxID=2035830 RepID=UPI003B7BA1BD